jgi:hypothetical protein
MFSVLRAYAEFVEGAEHMTGCKRKRQAQGARHARSGHSEDHKFCEYQKRATGLYSRFDPLRGANFSRIINSN